MRSWGLAVVAFLISCGGGTGATADGGVAGSGGAASLGGATGNGGDGPGGAPSTGGVAGSSIGGGGIGTGGAPSGGAAGTGGTAGAATGGHAAGGIGGMNCRPDILIVQDRSGSMIDDDNYCTGGCGANSKWTQATTAITNVVEATDGNVNWGIKYFPDNHACDASMSPAVGIAPSNGVAVATSIAGSTPGGNTPTRDAITYGAMYLESLTDTNPKYLLLATDGLPNCPLGCATMSNPSTSCTMTDNPSEDQAAETAVMMGAAQGIKTFVVGIGNVSTAVNTLNQLAIDGGEAQAGGATSYYVAIDEATLEAALTSIVGKIAGCGP